MKKLQPVSVDVNTRDGLFEGVVASLVTECWGIIEDRVKKALSMVSAEALAVQLWQGSINPRRIQRALLDMEKLQVFLAELSAELSSLTAGVFYRPVLLQVTASEEELLPKDLAGIIGEEMGWGKETLFLNKALMEACSLVWSRAVSDCAWPVRRLNPGKLLWCLAGVTPADEERRCLQGLTRSVEGVRANMQKRLFKAISLQVATQVWLLYDDVAPEKTTTAFIDPEKFLA
jgi:hypothetical protein